MLQWKIERLTEIGICYEMEMNVEKKLGSLESQSNLPQLIIRFVIHDVFL